MGRASRLKRDRRRTAGRSRVPPTRPSTASSTAGPKIADLLKVARAGLPDEIVQFRRLLLRLPFLQVVGNMLARAQVGYATGDLPFQMPIALEYVTWIYLTATEPFEVDGRPLGGEWEELEKSLASVLQTSMLATMSDVGALADRGKADLQMKAVMHETYIRQNGYQPHLQDQGEALFGPFAADLRRLGLVPYQEASRVLAAIVDLVEQRVNARREQGRAQASIWGKATIDPKAFSKLDKRAQEFVGRFENDIDGIVGSWVVFGLGDAFTVSVEEAASASGVGPTDVTTFMDAFSLDFGQSPGPGARPAIYDPLRRAPMVRLPNGRYLAHLVAYLAWTLRERYDDALMADPTVRDVYQEHRARYLEDEAIRLLAGTSPHAHVLRSGRYSFDDGEGLKEYEVDGLVFIDSVLFIIEAKAGRLSAAARRGARLMELEALVADAQKQAARVERYLRSQKPAVFEGPDGERLVISARPEATVILVNPTIEPLHAFVTRWSDVVAAGVGSAAPWVWSVSVTDLRAITEVVETAGQLVHFLDRRRALEELKVVAAEELDLFGHYIAHGLYLEEVRREQPDLVTLGSWTHDLDAHFEDGAPKPEMKIPDGVRELMVRLARLGPSGWVDATRFLLDGSTETLDEISGLLESRRGRVSSGAVDLAMARLAFENRLLVYMVMQKIHPTKLAICGAAAKRFHKANRVIAIGESTDNLDDVALYLEYGPVVEDADADAAAATFIGSFTTQVVRSSDTGSERQAQAPSPLPMITSPRRPRSTSGTSSIGISVGAHLGSRCGTSK